MTIIRKLPLKKFFLILFIILTIVLLYLNLVKKIKNYTPIKKIFVHFIIIGNKELSIINYLSIISAYVIYTPAKIYIHTDQYPYGKWWTKLLQKVDYNSIIINKVKSPSTIFGQEIKLIAHQIDILRIFILLEYGGIYIDNDIITMKKLDDSVLEALNSDVAIFGIDSLKTTKSSIVASNAFIGCYNCTFLHILLDSYKDFRQDIYDYNSGINLVLLVAQNTKKAKILNNLIITPKNPNTRQIINLQMYNSYHLQMHRNNLDLDNFSNPNSTISKNSTLYKIMKLYI